MTPSRRLDTPAPSSSRIDAVWETLRSFPAATLVVLEDGYILLATPRACTLLERSASDIEGRALDSFLAPLDELLHPSTSQGRPPTLRLGLKSGRQLIVSFSVAELSSLSHLQARSIYVIHLDDVTASERIREERDRLLQIATVHEALPAILHEIKNPLAAIATTAELLVEDANCEPLRASAQAILNEAHRMRRLLQGIGAVGNQLRTSRQHSAVDHVLREVGSMLRAKAELDGVRLRVDVPDMPLLPLDSSVLAAIVHNLVTNSIQATVPSGEVELVAAHDENKNRLRLRISDTGVGMTKDVIKESRKLFFTTKSKGTGIGLTLCDRAIRAAGGTMSIESTPSVGTTISLCIPTSPFEQAGAEEEQYCP